MISPDVKERLKDAIALLSIPGVGRGRFDLLIRKFGSAAAALAASTEDLMALPGLSEKTVRAIKQGPDVEFAAKTVARIAQLGWAVLFPDHDEYPALLRQIPDRPPLLFRDGSPPPVDFKAIAIVGTRHASESGRRFAEQLAADLTRSDLVVVSGMAEGIDSAAHRGALNAGGRTIAVWGTPLDQVYPPANKELSRQIRQSGCIFSEYLPGTPAEPHNFPSRNRIISGMAEGVIVVEAGRKSGALITARNAIDQGRELFAVPGSPWNNRSLGTNRLIKMGARLLTSADDVLDEIPRLKGEIKASQFRKMPDLTEIEKKIVDQLTAEALQIDALSRSLGLPVSELMEYLLALELKGAVTELPGKRFVLANQ